MSLSDVDTRALLQIGDKIDEILAERDQLRADLAERDEIIERQRGRNLFLRQEMDRQDTERDQAIAELVKALKLAEPHARKELVDGGMWHEGDHRMMRLCVFCLGDEGEKHETDCPFTLIAKYDQSTAQSGGDGE